MAVESLCRNCGSKDVHYFDGVIESVYVDSVVSMAAYKVLALLRKQGDISE